MWLTIVDSFGVLYKITGPYQVPGSLPGLKAVLQLEISANLVHAEVISYLEIKKDSLQLMNIYTS